MKDKQQLKNKGNINYPVGDFLIRLKNASIANRTDVVVRKSKLVLAVAEALKRERYLEEVKVKEREIDVRLTFRKKEPLLLDVKLISKPGLRVYMGVEEIEKKKGSSILIISTPLGVLSTKEAIKKQIGGEVIAEVY